MREIKLKLLCDFILFQSERQRLSKQKLINTGDCVRKGKLTRCWWQYKLGQPRWKLAWQFLRTLEVDFPYDPAVTLLDVCRKDPTSYYLDPRSFMFIAALLTIAGTWNRPRCPSNGEQRIKMQYLYKIEWYKKPDWSARVLVQHGLGLGGLCDHGGRDQSDGSKSQILLGGPETGWSRGGIPKLPKEHSSSFGQKSAHSISQQS